MTEELLKRRRKNIENLRKKNRENLLVRSIKSPFRGAGHIARTLGSTATMPLRGAGHVLRAGKAINDAGWRLIGSTATMPLRGAKNLWDVGASGIRYVNESAKASKKRRQRLGIGEYNEEHFPDLKRKQNKKSSSKDISFGEGLKMMEKAQRRATTTDQVLREETEKAAWLKKTRNSPAAASGAFTDEERWALQQKHRQWKASRGKK